MKQFSDKELEEATKRAPRYIQDEISSGEDTAWLIAQIGQKYKLTIELIGMLAELNRNTLLGLINPKEFMQELVASGIPQDHAQKILDQIKEEIYIPLRNKSKYDLPKTIKKDDSESTKTQPTPQVKPTAPPQPRVVPMNATVPSYGAPPLQSPRYVPSDKRPAVMVAPLPPKMAMPRAAVTINPETVSKKQEQTAAKPAIQQQAPMASKSVVEQPKELPVGEEVSSKQEQEAVVAPQISTPVSMPEVQARPIVQPAPAPMPTPAAPRPPIVAAPKSEAEFKTPPVPVRPAIAPDPYREPIEP